MNPFRLHPESARRRIDSLTMRERQVAEAVALGLTRSQAKTLLGVSIKTLDVHLLAVRRKLRTTTHGIGRIWFASQIADQKKMIPQLKANHSKKIVNGKRIGGPQ